MSMGIAAAATARKNMLKRSAEWRAQRRSSGDVVFLQSEQASRDKYNEFTKLSREFAKLYPNEFKTFLLAKQHNQVARQSFGIPRNMSETITPVTPSNMPTTLHYIDQRLTTPFGSIPSAAAIEGKRLKSAGINHLAELGIRLD
jgi:hypothetical protein